MTLAIETNRLTKFFGEVKAVDDLNLRVPEGRFHGLVGPNGAGKTTAIRMLCGMIRPTSGAARIMGFDVDAQPEQAKRQIAYVPENPSLYKSLTVSEFLGFIREVYSVPKDAWKVRVEKYVSMFEIVSLKNEFIGSLSRGWLQRVLICAVVSRDPPVFLLDEPFYPLDPWSAHVFKTLLDERCESGATVLLSTHTLEVAEKLCDTFTILDSGRTIAEGSLEEFRNKVSRDASLQDVFLHLTRKVGV